MTSASTEETKAKSKSRGRPKGSKNKKRLGRPPGSKSKRNVMKSGRNSLESTIQQLLTLPTNAETKIRLIQAALKG